MKTAAWRFSKILNVKLPRKSQTTKRPGVDRGVVARACKQRYSNVQPSLVGCLDMLAKINDFLPRDDKQRWGLRLVLKYMRQ